MQVLKPAMAGTLESSDVQVSLEPGGKGLELDISSSVLAQYGRQIKACAQETLMRLGVDNAHVTIVDKGALECTLKARIQCAVFRAAGVEKDYPWGGAVS